MKETLEIIKKRKNNMKIYPIYTMLGLDLLFFYGIKVLFLSQVKNIDLSYIVLTESFYAFFFILLQVPINVIMEKIGSKSSIVLGNVFNLLYIILMYKINKGIFHLYFLILVIIGYLFSYFLFWKFNFISLKRFFKVKKM